MMKERRIQTRESVKVHRAKKVAQGQAGVHLFLPTDVIAEIDRLKLERGASSRAPIMEEAIRFYLENTRA